MNVCGPRPADRGSRLRRMRQAVMKASAFAGRRPLHTRRCRRMRQGLRRRSMCCSAWPFPEHDRIPRAGEVKRGVYRRYIRSASNLDCVGEGPQREIEARRTPSCSVHVTLRMFSTLQKLESLGSSIAMQTTMYARDSSREPQIVHGEESHPWIAAAVCSMIESANRPHKTPPL